jgi:streptogramin lyase
MDKPSEVISLADSIRKCNAGLVLLLCLSGAIATASPEHNLTLGTNSLTFGHGAGAGTLIIGANAAWTASTSTPWLHITPGSAIGTGNGLFRFTYDANTGATRKGTISFNGGEAMLAVTQAGESYVPTSELTTLVPTGLSLPFGIAVDAIGNVYFTEGQGTEGQAVQKWTAATGQVTTLVSPGSTAPRGVAIDRADNVYFSVNATIQKWTAATGQVTTLVSDAAASYLAVDEAGNVYFTVSAGAFSAVSAVRKWTAATGQITTLVNTGSISPEGVAVDKDGNVYFTAVAGTGNGRVEKWTAATGQVTTLVSGLLLASGLAVDRVGNLYIADSGNNAIKKWTAATGQVTNLVSSGLNYPFGVAVDATGNVYIADTADFAIKEWMPATGQVTTLLSSELDFPTAVAVDEARNVYIADFNHNAIKKWSAATGQVTTVVSDLNAKPGGVAVDGTGNLYIAEPYGSVIEKWTAATATVSRLISSGLSQPWGIAVDLAGNLYISDRGDSAIKKWTSATSELTTLISNLDSPSVAVDGAGDLYIPDGLKHAIDKWFAATGEVTTLIATGLSSPYGVAVDGAENVYISDISASGGMVKKWTAATGLVAILPASGLFNVYGVGVDQAGNMYLTDNGHNSIKKITRAFVGPAGVAEPLTAGSGQLLPVLPLGTPLDAMSDQPWLTIGTRANGMVSFSFTPTAVERTAHIAVLGQSIPVIQVDDTLPTVVSYSVLWGSEIYTLTGSARSGLPWQISGLQVLFSKPIATADIRSLSGVKATALSGIGTNTLTWTIDPVSIASFTLSLAQSGPNAVKDAARNSLTGNTSQNLRVLWGDFNDDGVVGAADLNGVNQARLGGNFSGVIVYDPFADLNGDGVLDAADVQIVRTQIGATLP